MTEKPLPFSSLDALPVELNAIATNLAQEAKRHGLGILDGFLPPDLTSERQRGRVSKHGGFINGGAVPPHQNSQLGAVIKHRFPQDFIDRAGPQKDTRTLLIGKFRPYGDIETPGWTQFDYFMPTLDAYLVYSCATPSEVTRRINDALSDDPVFFPRFFIATYPGLVGENPHNQVRLPLAKKLIIRSLQSLQ